MRAETQPSQFQILWSSFASGAAIRFTKKTLPEAQQTQGIDSLTWVISPAK